MTLELGYGTHALAGRVLPCAEEGSGAPGKRPLCKEAQQRMEETPPATPLTLIPLIPQVRGLGPPKEKLKEPVTLSVIFPSEEPISSAVRLLPTPTQALSLLQGPLGNTGLLPTGLPVPRHPDASPRHPCRDRVSGTNSPGGAQHLARGCPVESSREGTGARVQHHEKWVLILSL